MKMKQRVPFVFGVASVFSAWFCLVTTGFVCFADPTDDYGWTVAGRGAAALLAVLAAVVTDALWNARPWVWRASLALAVAYAVSAFVATSTDRGSNLLDPVFGPAVSGVVVVVLLACIYFQVRAMRPKQPSWPQSTAPIAVPRPSAPMHPATGPGSRP
jgi:peptidoglycan/LPS O-acetylase OafA/YrhL